MLHTLMRACARSCTCRLRASTSAAVGSLNRFGWSASTSIAWSAAPIGADSEGAAAEPGPSPSAAARSSPMSPFTFESKISGGPSRVIAEVGSSPGGRF
eukprot:3220427-Prymnesium_polylepis.1